MLGIIWKFLLFDYIYIQDINVSFYEYREKSVEVNDCKQELNVRTQN